MIDQAAIDTFLAQLTAAKTAHMAKAFPNLTPPTFRADIGRKFVRIVQVNNQQSSFCFIDRATGDILKCAGWNAPAKGVRGHISNGAKDLTPYGAVYKIGCYMDTFGELGLA